MCLAQSSYSPITKIRGPEDTGSPLAPGDRSEVASQQPIAISRHHAQQQSLPYRHTTLKGVSVQQLRDIQLTGYRSVCTGTSIPIALQEQENKERQPEPLPCRKTPSMKRESDGAMEEGSGKAATGRNGRERQLGYAGLKQLTLLSLLQRYLSLPVTALQALQTTHSRPTEHRRHYNFR